MVCQCIADTVGSHICARVKEDGQVSLTSGRAHNEPFVCSDSPPTVWDVCPFV